MKSSPPFNLFCSKFGPADAINATGNLWRTTASDDDASRTPSVSTLEINNIAGAIETCSASLFFDEKQWKKWNSLSRNCPISNYSVLTETY